MPARKAAGKGRRKVKRTQRGGMKMLPSFADLKNVASNIQAGLKEHQILSSAIGASNVPMGGAVAGALSAVGYGNRGRRRRIQRGSGFFGSLLKIPVSVGMGSLAGLGAGIDGMPF